jgi:hypothetical protein
MPTSHKSDGSTKRTKKVAATLKRKASNIIKAILPKKKRKGPTGDTISETLSLTSAETSSSKSNEPIIVDGDSDIAEEEENSDKELGMSSFHSCF